MRLSYCRKCDIFSSFLECQHRSGRVERAALPKFGSYRVPPGDAAIMCAATPTFSAFDGRTWEHVRQSTVSRATVSRSVGNNPFNLRVEFIAHQTFPGSRTPPFTLAIHEHVLSMESRLAEVGSSVLHKSVRAGLKIDQ